LTGKEAAETSPDVRERLPYWVRELLKMVERSTDERAKQSSA